MLSEKMQLALTIFEACPRDTEWFGSQFWPSGRIDFRFRPDSPGWRQAQQVIDSMVAAGLLETHWKRTTEYQLTVKAKGLLAQAQLASR